MPMPPLKARNIYNMVNKIFCFPWKNCKLTPIPRSVPKNENIFDQQPLENAHNTLQNEEQESQEVEVVLAVVVSTFEVPVYVAFIVKKKTLNTKFGKTQAG